MTFKKLEWHSVELIPPPRLDSPLVYKLNRYQPPRYEGGFFFIKIRAIFPEKLTKIQKGALSHRVKKERN